MSQAVPVFSQPHLPVFELYVDEIVVAIPRWGDKKGPQNKNKPLGWASVLKLKSVMNQVFKQVGAVGRLGFRWYPLGTEAPTIS